MAAVSVTTASEIIYRSTQGTADFPDVVDVRLADQSGTVYLEVGGAASASTSIFIKDAEVFSRGLVAGQYIAAITASGTEELRVSGRADGTYGS